MGDGKGCVWGKMAKKKKSCKCKHWRRYEIISYCNILLTVGNAETGIWGGRRGVFFGGRMKIWKAGWKGWHVKRKIQKGVVNRKTDRQEKRRFFFFLSVHNNSTHMREISRLKR